MASVQAGAERVCEPCFDLVARSEFGEPASEGAENVSLRAGIAVLASGAGGRVGEARSSTRPLSSKWLASIGIKSQSVTRSPG